MTTSVAYADPTRTQWSTTAEGKRALARGELIILRHEARLVLVGCAGTVTTEQMAFIIRYSTGFVQVALHQSDCDRPGLPEAIPSSRTRSAGAYGQCVAVDAWPASPPVSPRLIGLSRPGCSPTPVPMSAPSAAPDISSRCAWTPTSCSTDRRLPPPPLR